MSECQNPGCDRRFGTGKPNQRFCAKQCQIDYNNKVKIGLVKLLKERPELEYEALSLAGPILHDTPKKKRKKMRSK